MQDKRYKLLFFLSLVLLLVLISFMAHDLNIYIVNDRISAIHLQIDYNSHSLIISSLAALLALVTIVIALLSVFGFGAIRTSAENTAEKTAEKRVALLFEDKTYSEIEKKVDSEFEEALRLISEKSFLKLLQNGELDVVIGQAVARHEELKASSYISADQELELLQDSEEIDR